MKRLFVFLVMVHVLSGAAFAASVDTFGIGAKATSMGGAVTASSDDVYSVYYNPAGLANIDRAQISAALQVCAPELKFHDYTVKDGTGATKYGPLDIKDDSDFLFIPFIGYAQPITGNVSFGIAALVPYGLDVEWKKNPVENPGAYNWFHSYYLRKTVNPTLSFKANDQWSFGVGVALGRSESGAEKVMNYPTKPSELKLDLTDSFNWSANAGVQFRPSDSVALGLAYRGRAKAKFDGDVKINGTKVTKATMRYDHPEQVQAGIMVKPNPSVTLEADVVWTNWRHNKTQTTYFDSPLLGLFPSETLERNWKSTNQVRIGAEWQVNEIVALRCGYFYDPSPVPDDTFDIMWPDADRKTYSIGAGFDFGNWVIDTSLQFAHAESKRILGGESSNINHPYNNPGVPEGYRVETSADGFLMGYGVTVTYKF